jgi:hypothetical protein
MYYRHFYEICIGLQRTYFNYIKPIFRTIYSLFLIAAIMTIVVAEIADVNHVNAKNNKKNKHDCSE